MRPASQIVPELEPAPGEYIIRKTQPSAFFGTGLAGWLVGKGVESVLATLGPHGAVLVNEQGAWHAMPPPTTVVSTVGAGDSSLFGYLLSHLRGDAPAQRLALAVAYGSAAAGLPGTTIPTPAQADPGRVHVSTLEMHLPGAPA